MGEWNAMCEAGNGVFGSMPSVEVCKERGAKEYAGASGKNSPTGNCKGRCKGDCEDNLGPCKRQCTVDYPPTLEEWNSMCEAGNGVFGSMPSVEVCKERGAKEYAGA